MTTILLITSLVANAYLFLLCRQHAIELYNKDVELFGTSEEINHLKRDRDASQKQVKKLRSDYPDAVRKHQTIID